LSGCHGTLECFKLRFQDSWRDLLDGSKLLVPDLFNYGRIRVVLVANPLEIPLISIPLSAIELFVLLYGVTFGPLVLKLLQSLHSAFILFENVYIL
jgi:hypothetical protein